MYWFVIGLLWKFFGSNAGLAIWPAPCQSFGILVTIVTKGVNASAVCQLGLARSPLRRTSSRHFRRKVLAEPGAKAPNCSGSSLLGLPHCELTGDPVSSLSMM